MNARPAIIVEGVRRSFRSPQKSEGLKGALQLLIKPQFTSHEALKGVSFSVEEGAFVGLIGANGAGKTTLLKILSGLIPPSEGRAEVLGFDPFERSLSFRHSIALVMGQKAQLWWDLPALDAFDLLRAIYEIPEKVYRERLNLLAELLDVKRHLQTQIRRLSLGERMKMELIGALLHWPKVIFLDEPTIGLDVLAAHKLREFLREFNRREKATIILTSHNMDDIERLCSRVLIVRSGEIIFDGAPQGLIREGECRLRVRLVQKPSASELAQATGILETQIEASNASDSEGDEDGDEGEEATQLTHYLAVKRDQVVPVLQALLARFQVIDMGIEEQSLERVIQNLYATSSN
jgi:ABC-2 type transport system ATP-binding protein